MIHFDQIGSWCWEHWILSLIVIWILGWLCCWRLVRYHDRRFEAGKYTWEHAHANFFFPMLLWPIVLPFITVIVFFQVISNHKLFTMDKDIDPPNWL